MAESGYYPPGAEHDPLAPYNQPLDPDEIEVDVDLSLTLDNVVTISTRNYLAVDDGDGGTYYDFSDVSLVKEYSESDVYIPTLLSEYADILKDRLKVNEIELNYYLSESNKMDASKQLYKSKISSYKNKINALKRKIAACEGYIVSDIYVEEN